jgi:HIRAN domain
MARMGLLDRILNRRGGSDCHAATAAPVLGESQPAVAVVLLPGSHDLEVVGESHYQDALWRVTRGRTVERVRVEVQAVLLAEPDNPYDPNAIAVLMDGGKVGYLCRDDAEAYRPGLLALEAR